MVIDLFDAIKGGSYSGLTVTKNADRTISVSGTPSSEQVLIANPTPFYPVNGAKLKSENLAIPGLAFGLRYYAIGSATALYANLVNEQTIDTDAYENYSLFIQVSSTTFTSPVTFAPLVRSSKGLCSNYRAMVRRRDLLLANSKKYLFVNYIEAAGSSDIKYINTGVNVETNTILEMDIQITGGYTYTFGAKGEAGRAFGLIENTTSQVTFHLYYDEAINYTRGRHVFKLDSVAKKGYIDGQQVFSSSRNISVSYPIYIFAMNETISGTEVTRNMYGKLYGCKIWNGSTLVRDLKPCVRKADNAVGMYDEVTKTFYGNAGTGAFTYG